MASALQSSRSRLHLLLGGGGGGGVCAMRREGGALVVEMARRQASSFGSQPQQQQQQQQQQLQTIKSALATSRSATGTGGSSPLSSAMARPHSYTFQHEPLSSRTSFTIQQLVAAGCHLGHSESRWHPNMHPFIYGTRDGVHIINVEDTLSRLRRAADLTREVAARDGMILFYGVRPEIRDIVVSAALRSRSYYMVKPYSSSARFLTNHLRMFEADILPDLIICLEMPGARVFLKEAADCCVPTIGICDTNCDPARVTYPVPGNDDSLAAIELYAAVLSNAAREGYRRLLAGLGEERVVETAEDFQMRLKRERSSEYVRRKGEAVYPSLQPIPHAAFAAADSLYGGKEDVRNFQRR